jgi:toxin ParE1/3/4
MRVIFLPTARKQLKGIYDFIAQDNETAARAVVARVEQIAMLLGANPRMGRKLPRGRLRRFPVHPFPYLIYYEIRGKDLRIIRVRHAARFRRALHDPEQAFRP